MGAVMRDSRRGVVSYTGQELSQVSPLESWLAKQSLSDLETGSKGPITCLG